jgi:hypothetical protein
MPAAWTHAAGFFTVGGFDIARWAANPAACGVADQ